MTAKSIVGPVRAIVLALMLVAFASPGHAQQPSASAVAMAKEIIVLKGATELYGGVVPGVIERVKAMMLQTNPMLTKDMNDVAAKLRTDYAPKTAEVINNAAKLYASQFTEQELKDALAFYRSPVGKKIVTQEPQILDRSVAEAETWAERFSEEVIAKVRAEMKKKGHDL